MDWLGLLRFAQAHFTGLKPSAFMPVVYTLEFVNSSPNSDDATDFWIKESQTYEGQKSWVYIGNWHISSATSNGRLYYRGVLTALDDVNIPRFIAVDQIFFASSTELYRAQFVGVRIDRAAVA